VGNCWPNRGRNADQSKRVTEITVSDRTRRSDGHTLVGHSVGRGAEKEEDAGGSVTPVGFGAKSNKSGGVTTNEVGRGVPSGNHTDNSS